MFANVKLRGKWGGGGGNSIVITPVLIKYGIFLRQKKIEWKISWVAIHLKTWTSFSETFPVGPNRSTEIWTAISGNSGWMLSPDRALGVMLCYAFSTHVTPFLDTRRMRGGFASVCLSFFGHEDKPGHKVQPKNLPTSYLLERIDICCKVWILWVTLLCRDTRTGPLCSH